MSAGKRGELEGFRIMMYGMSGDAEKAVATLEAYMEGDAEDEAKQQVAAAGINVYLSEKRFDDAIAIFEKVIALGPDTEIGKISAAVTEAKDEEEDTPLKKKIDEFGDLLAKVLRSWGEALQAI